LNGKAQVSLEYVVLTSLVLVFISVVFVFASITVSDSVSLYQAKASAKSLAEAINRAHSLGPGTKIFVELDLPYNILEPIWEKGEVGFVVSSFGGSNNIYESVDADFNGEPLVSGGSYSVLVETLENGMVRVGEWNPEDTTGPAIKLLEPRDGQVVHSGNIDFVYYVEDRESTINYCSLYIDYKEVLRDYSVDNYRKNLFVKNLSPGRYKWNVICVDTSVNENPGKSEVFKFLVFGIIP